MVGTPMKTEKRRERSRSSVVRRVEGRAEDGGRAGVQRAMQGDDQAMHVKDGQRVQQHIVAAPAPGFVQGGDIGGQIAMRDLRAFGAAGGAAGVEHHRGLVGVGGQGVVAPR